MERTLHVLRKGFTLVELLIVIIIIAVLAAIAIPKFADSSTRSKEAALHADLRLYRNAIELFKADCGAYPKNLGDLAVATLGAAGSTYTGKDGAGVDKTFNVSEYKGPYLHEIELDPISGAAFTYTYGGASTGSVISSAAGNGLDGTPYNKW